MRPLHELLRRLEAQGWSVERTARGGYRLRAPDGALLFTARSGDWRAIRNTKSLLRRHGAKV